MPSPETSQSHGIAAEQKQPLTEAQEATAKSLVEGKPAHHETAATASQLVANVLSDHHITAADNAAIAINDGQVLIRIHGKKHNELIAAGNAVRDALFSFGQPMDIVFEDPSAGQHGAKIFISAKTSETDPVNGAQTEIKL